jgi:hypothetical protein
MHPEIQLLVPILLHGMAPLSKLSKQMGRSPALLGWQ